jgi:hypothetical protein
MNYPSIRIEGSILSPDILDRLEDAPGQKPSDFGLEASGKVKDEIARAWADAQDYWRIFQRKLASQKPTATATSETRQLWTIPLLGLLGYQLEYHSKGSELNGKIYAISHRATNRAQTPVHIIGYRDPSGLDRKPEGASLRMSPHAMVQEYLNLHDHLYGIITNGRVLRLLRDSSRLVKLCYLEFDLDRIFSDGLFADFAILYRLLHATRLPVTTDTAAESLIERYHQDSLDSGARIRDGLSRAVEQAIRDFGNGFLTHPANDALCAAVKEGKLSPETYYKYLLNLIYRLLFLMVIEERGLVFPPPASKAQREIYRLYYSVQRLRLLSEKRHLADPRRHDLWLSLLANFRLFEAEGPGSKLGLAPLAGDLFGCNAVGILAQCQLGNDVLLACLRSLSLYEHPDNRQLIRVNYAALNVEEFGSVYEGLLEYEPIFENDGLHFAFKQGDQRAATGSHYTPDELVQPLIKHSLDYLIADKLKEKDKEKALLSLRVADISCGSGHILLAAARRIATELASVRTGEEQPSPVAFRSALRDVIRECIYGVDLNPLAVELCKVALWLEAHNPGQPLNFLDHHVKCGNSIVGYVRRDELDQGVPDEAFAFMPGDDKEIATQWRKRNKADRIEGRQRHLEYSEAVRGQLDSILQQWHLLSALPERTHAEIETKKSKFAALAANRDTWTLKQIADIPVAQFYTPKTPESDTLLISDAQFRRYWNEGLTPQGQPTASAWATAHHKRFFHWFLEFPEILENGGFDCILGNPPYKGGQHLSGLYGHSFCEYVRWAYAPAGLSDLVVYFVRRIFTLLKPNGFTAFITTNSIKDGDIRKDGLEQVIAHGASINMAVRGIKWPGMAKLFVSLVSLYNGKWSGKRLLDNQEVVAINAYFEDSEIGSAPLNLKENEDHVFQGSVFLGDGFLITHDHANRLCLNDPRNKDVIFPITNGQEVNSQPDQKPGRSIINFHDWQLEQAQTYTEPFFIVESKVKPVRDKDNMKSRRERWWQFGAPATGLYAKIKNLHKCFAIARTTKYLSLSEMPTNLIFSDAVYVFTTDRWDLYATVQSTVHETWARKYSGSLETRLRYSPSDCFDNFAFPENLWRINNPTLAAIGESYHSYRKSLMLSLWIGLTDIYNLVHSRELSPTLVAKVSKKSPDDSERGYNGILELRRLHIALDTAVRDAYGWQDLALGHDFYEMETLPENDRIRYTISPTARKELLKRLLALNHTRAAEETAKAVSVPASKPKRHAKPKTDAYAQELPLEMTSPYKRKAVAYTDHQLYCRKLVLSMLSLSADKLPLELLLSAWVTLYDAKKLADVLGNTQEVREWASHYPDQLTASDSLQATLWNLLERNSITVSRNRVVSRCQEGEPGNEDVQMDAQFALTAAEAYLTHTPKFVPPIPTPQYDSIFMTKVEEGAYETTRFV